MYGPVRPGCGRTPAVRASEEDIDESRTEDIYFRASNLNPDASPHCRYPLVEQIYTNIVIIIIIIIIIIIKYQRSLGLQLPCAHLEEGQRTCQ